MRVRYPGIRNSSIVAVADISRHVDQYTRKHERQQLEKLRKEVRVLYHTARGISIQV